MPHIRFKDNPEKRYPCSMRLIRICSDNRINRVADFSRMTRDDLLSLPECGKATALQVSRILKDNGLDFCENIDKRRIKDPSQRSRLISELVSNGQSYRKIGERIGMSASRVAQIYKQHASADNA